MEEVMRVLQEADVAAVTVEQARQKFESAKIALEQAKELLEEGQNALNQIFLRAEEVGVAKSRLKKLIEERTQALVSSGLLQDLPVSHPRPPKISRKKTAAPQHESSTFDAAPGEPPPIELQ